MHFWFSDAKVGEEGNQLITAYKGLKGGGFSGSETVGEGSDFEGDLCTLRR